MNKGYFITYTLYNVLVVKEKEIIKMTAIDRMKLDKFEKFVNVTFKLELPDQKESDVKSKYDILRKSDNESLINFEQGFNEAASKFNGSETLIDFLSRVSF